MDKASTIVLAASLIIIMLGMGLSLVAEDFKRIILYPKAIFVGLVNQIILLPLIGFAIAVLFPLTPEVAIGIMILAACPGGPTSNLITHLANQTLSGKICPEDGKSGAKGLRNCHCSGNPGNSYQGKREYCILFSAGGNCCPGFEC